MDCGFWEEWVLADRHLGNSVEPLLSFHFLLSTSYHCICSGTSVFSFVPATAAAVVDGLFTAITVAADFSVAATVATADLVTAIAVAASVVQSPPVSCLLSYLWSTVCLPLFGLIGGTVLVAGGQEALMWPFGPHLKHLAFLPSTITLA